MLLLAFGHKARQGKDTAGQAVYDYYEKKRQLALRHGLRVIPSVGMYKFATALYSEANRAIEQAGDIESLLVNGFYEDDAHYNIPEYVKPTPNPEKNDQLPHGKHGALLQWWGTEFRRRQDPNYWVKKCFEQIEHDMPHIAVITDARFKNEVSAVKAYGGHTIKVERLNEDGTPYFATDRPANHQSEVDLDGYNFDYYIKAKTGQVVWVEQQAITLAEMLRGLE